VVPEDPAASREAEIESILTRLREEVRRNSPSEEVAPAPAASVAARADAEGLWPVTADRLIERRAGLRGTAVYVVKTVLRKLMRWYVEPFAASQRAFNLAAQTRLIELEERLTRVERARRTARPAPAPVASFENDPPLPAPSAMPDYFAFESRMRGSTAEVRARQAVYVEDFRTQAPVLDLGCGRGEFLGLLAAAEVEARGIDANPDMVDYCHGEGLDVDQADVLEHLESLESGSLGGIFCAHVVEHLEPPKLVRLFELAATRLRAGGLFVAETPNPRTLFALSNFFADLTHAQPIHPETISLLARQTGFESAEIRYLHEPPVEARLQLLLADGKRDSDAAVLNGNFERLNELVFGPQDFALVART
jgi:2-polyprenyl-3-methyl-5-hydroxy-6-metoxy-1,4-benzoquinol methylase